MAKCMLDTGLCRPGAAEVSLGDVDVDEPELALDLATGDAEVRVATERAHELSKSARMTGKIILRV